MLLKCWAFNKPCHNPFDGLLSLNGDFNNLYTIILQRGIDVTFLERNVKGLIKQAYDLKDLRERYSG